MKLEIKEYTATEIMEALCNIKSYCFIVGCDNCRYGSDDGECPFCVFIRENSSSTPNTWTLYGIKEALEESKGERKC